MEMEEKRAAVEALRRRTDLEEEEKLAAVEEKRGAVEALRRKTDVEVEEIAFFLSLTLTLSRRSRCHAAAASALLAWRLGSVSQWNMSQYERLNLCHTTIAFAHDLQKKYIYDSETTYSLRSFSHTLRCKRD